MRLVVTVVIAFMLSLVASPAIANQHRDCRNYGAEQTVKCIAEKQNPPGGVSKALFVWRCESGFKYEGSHGDSYHGPFQYLTSTYESQLKSMPDIRRWFELSSNVHDPRSNIITAIAWAARNHWGPWSCG